MDVLGSHRPCPSRLKFVLGKCVNFSPFLPCRIRARLTPNFSWSHFPVRLSSISSGTNKTEQLILIFQITYYTITHSVSLIIVFTLILSFNV